MKCIEDEIPFEVPEGWSWTRGHSILCGMNTRKPTGEYFRYIDIDAIDNKMHSVREPKVIETVSAPSRASRAVEVGNILFSLVRPYLENIAYVTEELRDCIASTGFYVCNFSTFLHPRYMFQVMTSNYVISGLNQYMKGDNSPSINSENIEKWLYPVAPFAEQEKISSKCIELLEIMSNIERDKVFLNDVLANVKSKILDLAIRGKLVPQDPNDEPASELLEHIRAEKEELIKQGKIKRDKRESIIFKDDDNSYYDDIPSGWSRIFLKDVCEVINGFAFKSTDFSQNGTPIIRISDIKNGIISTEDCVYWTQEPDKRFGIKKGDLLIAMSGATTGKMGVYENDFPAYLNQRVGNVRIKDRTIICTEYRNIYLQGMQDIILKNAYGGAQPNISSKFIEEISFLLPPHNEQLRIVSKVKMLFNILNKIEKSFI